jgi:hypothetical protein
VAGHTVRGAVARSDRYGGIRWWCGCSTGMRADAQARATMPGVHRYESADPAEKT